MKPYLPLLLLILLMSACAPAQVETPTGNITTPVISTQVNPPPIDTPLPLTATPYPPTATTDPTQAYITLFWTTKMAILTGTIFPTLSWSTKSAMLTANPAPTFPTETPTPTMHPGSTACRPRDLHVTFVGPEGAAGHIVLTIQMDNTSSTDCFLPDYPVVQILDPTRKPLNLTYSYCAPDCPVVPVPPTDEAHPGEPARFGLKRGQSALLSIWWSNECDKNGLPRNFIIDIQLLGGAGTVEIANHEFLGGTPCYDPSLPPAINIEPLYGIGKQ